MLLNDRFDPYRVHMETSLDEVVCRVEAYMQRQMPMEAFLVGKNRWKDEILIFIKSGYEHIKKRVPNTFNQVNVVMITINQIGDNT